MPNDKEFELDDLESFSFDDLSLDEAPPVDEAPTGEDPFGVWVKSAPEDVDTADQPLEDLDLSSPPTEDILPEEDFLSSEELANLDDSFDFVTVEEPLEGESPLEEEMAFLDTPEALEAEQTLEPESVPSFDEVSLDDFVSFDEVTLDAAGPGAPTDTLDTPEEELDEEFLDIDIDINDDVSDRDLEITPAPIAVSSPLEEVDLGEFGDFQEVSAIEGADFFEEQILDVESEPLDLEPDDHTDMDHILALEEDLTAGIREPEPMTEAPAVPVAPVAPAAATSDLAALILEKIEQELSSIKQEISELKNEVTHLRVAPVVTRDPEPTPEEEAPIASEPAHGFFDEEDDETIALTGDELDNILSTAEISEGEEVGLTLEEDLLTMDAEGNLLEPAVSSVEDSSVEEETFHVTDEEFLSGTALDLNEPDPFVTLTEEADALGVPDSIELEEEFPLGLDDDETEDLLVEPAHDFEVDPLPEGLLEGTPEPLEIPFDDDIGLELVEEPLAPSEERLEEELPSLDDLSFETLPPPGDPEGWSPPVEILDQDAEVITFDEPLPAPVPVAVAPSTGGLSPGLKEELRAVLSYMDKLLASLPDDKIQEFAESEHFEVYKRLFEELGLIE